MKTNTEGAMAKKQEEKITCVHCSGKGYQEEDMKSYRRYICIGCNGEKMIADPFNEVGK